MNKKVVIGSIIAVLVIAMTVVGITKSMSTSSAFGGGNAYKVKVEKIQKGDISSYVTANGVVQEVEKSEVFFDTPLKVVKVLVTEGDKVVKGQKILELDTSTLSSELEKLKVNKNIQEMSLDSKTISSEVERAQSALNSAERNYNDSKKTYLNNKELYAANAISKNELELSEKAYIQAESALNDSRSAYSTALESKKINKNTAQDNLKITDMSISDLENKIKTINDSLASPMDGVVAALNVETGAFTSNMQAAYKVINPDKLEIRANIKEFDVKNVTVGQAVRITGDAIDKDKNISGKITAISPVATVNRTTSGDETVVGVTIAVDDSNGLLKPGFNVTCDIYTVDKKGVIIAPMGMITEDVDGNKMVYVADTSKNIMKETKIMLGINSDMNVEVLEGLKEGDLVIVDPLPAFRDGARIKIIEQK